MCVCLDVLLTPPRGGGSVQERHGHHHRTRFQTEQQERPGGRRGKSPRLSSAVSRGNVYVCKCVCVCRHVVGFCFASALLQDVLHKVCKDRIHPREKKLCYYIEPIKRDVSRPLSNGVPADRICKRLKK